MTVTQADLDWFAGIMATLDEPGYFDSETPAQMTARIKASGKSKARRAEQIATPTANAFGDYGHYDADGNPVMEGALIFSEFDALNNDWVPYATQTEQRMAERGDDVTFDATSQAAYSRGGKGHVGPDGKWVIDKRGDRELIAWNNDARGTVFIGGNAYSTEDVKHFTDLMGYHSDRPYQITCWYCAQTFHAAWFGGNADRVAPSQRLKEHFAYEAYLHYLLCRYEHEGVPLIRMVDYHGKPVLRRAGTWQTPQQEAMAKQFG